MACEKCWGDAWIRSQWNGKSQAENYHDLLLERADKPCSFAEQEGKVVEQTEEER